MTRSASDLQPAPAVATERSDLDDDDRIAEILRASSSAERIAAVTARAWSLPAILDAEGVAQLLGVSVKVVYEAVRDLGLPLRPVGQRKHLRGSTVAVLLWLGDQSASADGRAALRSSGQGRVARKTRGRR